MAEFEHQLRKQGGSFITSIPPELVKHMKAEDGDVLVSRDETGKKGEYFSTWKKKT